MPPDTNGVASIHPAAGDASTHAGLQSPSTAKKGLRLVVNIDGAARGNPGPAGIGVAMKQEDGLFQRELWRYIGEATNNVAEYEALLLALREARRLKAAAVKIRSDSELLVRQIEGRYRVKSPRLVELYVHARNLIKSIQSFQIEHVRRALNIRADALANRAIDEAFLKARRDEKGLA